MSDYLDQIERQLVELTERGAHRRPRVRREALAVAAAVLAVAAVAVVIATVGSRAHRTTPASHSAGQVTTHHHAARHGARTQTTTSGRSTSPVSAGGPVPAGFGPESFTATGELTWWLLGSAPCSSPPCTSIVRTTDGGRTFVGIPAPRTENVSQLRFADTQNGFAYGPELWATHDGGGQWHAIPLSAHAQVADLAIGGGYVYAIATSTSGGPGQLLRSAVGSDSWSALPGGAGAVSGLWVHGSDVLLEAASASGQRLMVSHDGGSTFTAHAAPPNVACHFEEPAPPVIWAHCATGMLSGTWRSVDGGRSFSAAGSGMPEMPNSAAFGAASESTAVVGYRQLYRTTDGGATWSPTSGPSGITSWQYLGFTDPTHGVAVGYVGTEQPSNERLYYTTDAGASYHLVNVG